MNNDIQAVRELAVARQQQQVQSFGGTNRLPNPLAPILFLATSGLGAAYMFFGAGVGSVAGIGAFVGSILLGSFLASATRIAAQWEKAIVFRFGRHVGNKGPGFFWLWPMIDTCRIVDTRIQTIDIPHRQAITKDNVPVRVDGVIFMRVSDPAAAVIRVQNYIRAVLEYSQTALRDVVGGMTLDQILADRELLGKKIQDMVESEIDGWGLDVASIRIQDIELPEDLKKVMAREASAEREKRATITKAEGDREAAENLAAAAMTMASSPGAMHLRTLQSLDSLGTSASNTVLITLPMEITDALGSVPKLVEALKPKAVDKKE